MKCWFCKQETDKLICLPCNKKGKRMNQAELEKWRKVHFSKKVPKGDIFTAEKGEVI